MMHLGRLQILEESRVDRQRGHIIHNPIFALGLRFFVDFHRKLVASSWAFAASYGVRTTGIGRGADILLTRL
jgi:hypothetical protein